jgi:hypothetical protein
LRLALDPAWQPASPLPELHTAEQLAPGRGFIVTLPLQYWGAAVPIARDSSRPRAIVMAVGALTLALGLGLGTLFAREKRHGRFAPLATGIDEAWLREQIFSYPAEMVGAAWDEGIGTPEVVALIARMVSEGKLQSTVSKSGSMTLVLTVDRTTLEGHERALVDGLFFGGRTQTSPKQVQQHYKKSGFDPAATIRSELQAVVERVMPDGPRRWRLRLAIPSLVVGGLALLGFDFLAGRVAFGFLIGVMIGSLLLLGLARGLGITFRAQIHWGYRAAWACVSPSLVMFMATVAFLWFVAGPGIIEASVFLVTGIVVLALAVMLTSIEAMMSRQHGAAIAFRKRLAWGRAFFISELEKDQPALRDEWGPWVLAFGLANQVDNWSTRHQGGAKSSRTGSAGFSSTSSASPAAWTGFGGGRSGGAGGGAAWVSAASGMAAGVSPPSSSGSGSGSSSRSSSSSSSSGGGGGGGW